MPKVDFGYLSAHFDFDHLNSQVGTFTFYRVSPWNMNGKMDGNLNGKLDANLNGNLDGTWMGMGACMGT